MLTGTILWYDEKDGNGIIQSKEGQKYYFDNSVISESMKKSGCKKGALVEFMHNEQITSTVSAFQVTERV